MDNVPRGPDSLASRFQKGSFCVAVGDPTLRSFAAPSPFLMSSNRSSTLNAGLGAVPSVFGFVLTRSPPLTTPPLDRPSSSAGAGDMPAAFTFPRSFCALLIMVEKSNMTRANRSGSWCSLILATSSP